MKGASSQPSCHRPGRNPAAATRTGPLGWILRGATVVLAPLLFVELALRLAGPGLPRIAPLLYRPKLAHEFEYAQTLEELLEHSVLGFRPGTRHQDFILNSRSLLTREYSDEKPAGTLRILAIGDSFTFSATVPYPSGWPVRLETLLEDRLGTRVEVLNLGVPAVGVEFERRLWLLEGQRLGADLVVLGFPVGSNFFSFDTRQRRATWSDPLARWSYICRLVRNALRLRAFRARPDPPRNRRQEWLPIPADARGVMLADVLPDAPAQHDPNQPMMSAQAFADLQQIYLRACAGRNMQPMFDATAQALLRFKDEVVATGTGFLVLICPAELQVDLERLREVLAATQMTPLPTESEVYAPQEFLRDFFEREGVDHLDLLPAFREAASQRGLYGPRDSHWNIAGNELAASVLADHLAGAAYARADPDRNR